MQREYYDTRLQNQNFLAFVNLQGDSGAPLVYFDDEVPTLYGTVSFLPSSGCYSGFPVGYVRTSTVTQWIDGVLIDFEDVC